MIDTSPLSVHSTHSQDALGKMEFPDACFPSATLASLMKCRSRKGSEPELNKLSFPKFASLKTYTEYDVLQGRGKGISRHKGNQRFLGIIKHNCIPYIRAGSNKERKKIVDAVLCEVLSKGRFLERKGADKEWVVISEKKIREKVSQALRYQQRAAGLEIENKSSTSSPSPSSSSASSLVNEDILATDLSFSLSDDDFSCSPDDIASPSEKYIPVVAVDPFEDDISEPLVSDDDIWKAIGASHIMFTEPIAALTHVSPQEEVADLL